VIVRKELESSCLRRRFGADNDSSEDPCHLAAASTIAAACEFRGRVNLIQYILRPRSQMTTRALHTTAQLLKHRSIVGSRRLYSKKVIQGRSNPSCFQNQADSSTEHDVVLLQRKSHTRGSPFLSKPLVPNQKILVPGLRSRDGIATEDIIGKAVRDIVSSKVKGVEYRIHEPSLAQYTNLTPRLVTPVSLQIFIEAGITNCMLVDLLSRCKAHRFSPRPSPHSPSPR